MAALTREQGDSNEEEAASDKKLVSKKKETRFSSNLRRSFGGISVKTKGCSCEQTRLLQQTGAAAHQTSSPHRRRLLFIGVRLDPEIKWPSLSTMAVLLPLRRLLAGLPAGIHSGRTSEQDFVGLRLVSSDP